MLSRHQAAVQAQTQAATTPERAKAACETAAALSVVLHARLADLLAEPGPAAEKLAVAKLITEMATAGNQIHALERRALGLDSGESPSDKTDLETVLRELEERGEIVGPKAAVSEAAQREGGT